MENYIKIYATNIKYEKHKLKKEGEREREKYEGQKKFKTTMKNEYIFVGGVA